MATAASPGKMIEVTNAVTFGTNAVLTADAIRVDGNLTATRTNSLAELHPFSDTNLTLSGGLGDNASYAGLNNIGVNTLRIGERGSNYHGTLTIVGGITLGGPGSKGFDPLADRAGSTNNTTALALYAGGGQILGTNNAGFIMVPRLSVVATNIALLSRSNDVYFLAGRLTGNSQQGHIRMQFVEQNNLDWLFKTPQNGGIAAHLDASFDGERNPAPYLPIDDILGFSPLGLGEVAITPNNGTKAIQDLQRGYDLFVEVQQTRQAISAVDFDLRAKDIAELIKGKYGDRSIWYSFALKKFEPIVDYEEKYKPEYSSKWLPAPIAISGSTPSGY
jgi:hypothetical protein